MVVFMGSPVESPSGNEVTVDLDSASVTLTVAAHGLRQIEIYSTIKDRAIILPDATGFASIATAKIGFVNASKFPIRVYTGGTVNTDQVLLCILQPGAAGRFSSSSIAAAKGVWTVTLSKGSLLRELTFRAGATEGSIDIGTNGFSTVSRGDFDCIAWFGTANASFTGVWQEATTLDIEGAVFDIDSNHAITAGSLTTISATANDLRYPFVLGRSDADAVLLGWYDATATATWRGNGATEAARVLTLGTAIDINAGITTNWSVGSQWAVEDFGEGGNFWAMSRTGSGQALTTLNLSGNTLVAGDNIIIAATGQTSTRFVSHASTKAVYLGEDSSSRATLNAATASDFTAAPSEDWESKAIAGDIDNYDGIYGFPDGTNKSVLARVESSWGILDFTASGLVSWRDLTFQIQLETTAGLTGVYALHDVVPVGRDMCLALVHSAGTVNAWYGGLFRPSELIAWFTTTDKHELASIPVWPIPGLEYTKGQWANGSIATIFGAVVQKDTKNTVIGFTRQAEPGSNAFARYRVYEIPEYI